MLVPWHVREGQKTTPKSQSPQCGTVDWRLAQAPLLSGPSFWLIVCLFFNACVPYAWLLHTEAKGMHQGHGNWSYGWCWEANWSHLCSPPYSDLWERSVLEPRAFWLLKAGWPVDSMDLLNFCFPSAEIIGACDQALFSCLPAELSLQSQDCWTL